MTNASIINVIRNYWRFDHGQQHTHTWHDREDFIRDHLVPLAARIAELEAERDRLAAIVERLPRTADGVPLYRGMKVYWRSQDPTTTRDGRTLVTYGVDEEGDFEGTDENGDWIPFDFGICSTAEAAAKGDS